MSTDHTLMALTGPRDAPWVLDSATCTETDPLLLNGHYLGSKVMDEASERDVEDGEAGGSPSGERSESVRSMVIQILVPFLLAGLGTVSYGTLPVVAAAGRRDRGRSVRKGRRAGQVGA